MSEHEHEPKAKVGGRIPALDGLRAVAVLGVMWVHVWSFCDNPAFVIGRMGSFPLDLHRLLAVVGNGVSLFFVISGFCMHLMYGRRHAPSARSYAEFIVNRWKRIAPAFYAAVLVHALGFALGGRFVGWDVLAMHALFLHVLQGRFNALCPPFWSLYTEWQFYLVLPVLLWAFAKLKFWPVLLGAMAFSIAFRFWALSNGVVENGFAKTAWAAQIPYRLIEFLWGVAIAQLWAQGVALPRWLRGSSGVLLAVAIIYAGRFMMMSEVVRAAKSGGLVLQTLSEPILTLGYAALVWNVVASRSFVRPVLEHSWMQTVGRCSYSLYLWHWFPCLFIATQSTRALGENALAQNVAMLLSLAVLLPMSLVSYRWLEAAYFTRRAASPALYPAPASP